MSGDRGPDPLSAYKLRWKRRRLLWRCFRSRHHLTSVVDRTSAMGTDTIAAVLVVRNEALRLPHFLDHYRKLGVGHFLAVDNATTDDTAQMLADAPDVSLWHTGASYRDARFGLDWATWLMMRHCHDRWCLMVDADELLVYAQSDTRPLPELTTWLDGQGRRVFGALMLDLYGDAPLGEPLSEPDPIAALPWFDPGPYRAQRQAPMRNLWVQGGMRERVFFADDPVRSPTLNKLPLVRWNRRWAFVNSCHAILPWHLNLAYSGPGGEDPSGVLLHTKFLPDVVDRAQEDLGRGAHFSDPGQYRDYYARIADAPTLWYEGSERLVDWRQLEALGLMNAGGW